MGNGLYSSKAEILIGFLMRWTIQINFLSAGGSFITNANDIGYQDPPDQTALKSHIRNSHLSLAMSVFLPQDDYRITPDVTPSAPTHQSLFQETILQVEEYLIYHQHQLMSLSNYPAI